MGEDTRGVQAITAEHRADCRGDFRRDALVPHRDRGIWVWYCRRIGLDAFLDIADEVISSSRLGELRCKVLFLTSGFESRITIDKH